MSYWSSPALTIGGFSGLDAKPLLTFFATALIIRDFTLAIMSNQSAFFLARIE
jgi:hypothetical protein